jgi:hypothetical protein
MVEIWAISRFADDVMLKPFSASNSRRDFRLFFGFSGHSIGIEQTADQKVQYGRPCSMIVIFINEITRDD